MSETLKELPAALAKFQAEHHAAGKDGKGNYGTYTTLAGALNAVQPATAYGLSHVQVIEPISDELMVLKTLLLHNSGESITSALPLPIRSQGRGNEMQAMGSALTYARRYGLLAIYGLAGDDDDAESTTQLPAVKSVKTTPTPAQGSKAPATAKEPPEKAAEPGVSQTTRKEVLAVLVELRKADPELFATFETEYRAAFDLPKSKRISDHFNEKRHNDFVQQFLAQHTQTK
ncbi:MAG: ERF family protein [Vulcanococcus sp.]